jgi:hypothetical protein
MCPALPHSWVCTRSSVLGVSVVSTLAAGKGSVQPSDDVVHLQAAFHALSTRQHMPPYYEASPRHAQQPRAHEEAPIEYVYSIQGACIGVGTAFFFVLVWWWNSGVSDGTRQHDMTRMVKEERYPSYACGRIGSCKQCMLWFAPYRLLLCAGHWTEKELWRESVFSRN